MGYNVDVKVTGTQDYLPGYSFNIKGGEKLSISNLNKEKLDNNGSKVYNANILYSKETRMTWDGSQAYYSRNNTEKNYIFDIANYKTSNLDHIASERECKLDYNGNANDYFENSGVNIIDEKNKSDAIQAYNPNEFEINKNQLDILKEVINTNKKDGENTLSREDLIEFYKKFKEDNKVFSEYSINNITFDGNNGIYNIHYTNEKGETENLVFDFVMKNERPTVQNYENITEGVHCEEMRCISEFQNKVNNYKEPETTIKIWVTALKNLINNSTK